MSHALRLRARLINEGRRRQASSRPIELDKRRSPPQLSALNGLPESCFEPFAVWRLRKPAVVWTNLAHQPPRPLADYAFAIPLPNEPGSAYTSEQSTAWAERYGGFGVGNNGGGARSGLVADLQLKGIGRNPLAGDGNDYFHMYGGASMTEAIIEAIWGEVCHAALPYGAVRVRAVLETGTKVPRKYPRSDQVPHTARAVALRDPALRMGHFMRSPFFRDPNGYEKGGMADSRRTQDAISAVSTCLPRPLVRTGEGSEEILIDGVQEFLRRQAIQIGTARSKRIMHGSLTASNTTLDGAWIDFAGGISTLSDYGPIILPRGAPDFLREEELLRESFSDFCFYASKHHPAGGALRDQEAQLWSYFRAELKAAANNGLLSLFGGDLDTLKTIDPALTEAVLSCIARIARTTGATPFTVLSSDNDAEQLMPLRMGRNHINLAILIAVLSARPGMLLESECLMTEAIPDSEIRLDCHKVFSAYAAATMRALSDPARQELALYDAMRYNLPCHQLYRTTLYPRLESCVDRCVDDRDWASVAILTNNLIRSGKMHLGIPRPPFAGSRSGPSRAQWRELVESGEQAPVGAIPTKLIEQLRRHAKAE